MVSVFSPVREMTPHDFARVTQVTYLGAVYGTLAALGNMLPRDRGVIVQVGSALGDHGVPLQSANCAAKHALLGFTESLRAELLDDGSHVRVSMVEPPGENTPQFDWLKNRMPRQPQPAPRSTSPRSRRRPSSTPPSIRGHTASPTCCSRAPATAPSNCNWRRRRSAAAVEPLGARPRRSRGARAVQRDARTGSVQVWATCTGAPCRRSSRRLVALSWLGFRLTRG